MTFNLSAVEQKQTQLIVTIDEIVEMLRKLPGGGYQTLQYYDRNGNLVQKQIPNIGQLIEQFRQGVNAQMSKTVYVHQQEGSDTSGDGSQNAPFKSIQKAVNSVPPGGVVTVVLISDYVVDNWITITDRVCTIRGSSLNPDGSPRISLSLDSSKANARIHVMRGHLLISDLILNADKNSSSAPHWATLLKTTRGNSTIVIGRWVDISQRKRSVVINLNFPLVNVEEGFANIHLQHVKIEAPNSQTLITRYSSGAFIYNHAGVLDVNNNVQFPKVGLNI